MCLPLSYTFTNGGVSFGGLEEIRTPDPHNANVVRSQLRYEPVDYIKNYSKAYHICQTFLAIFFFENICYTERNINKEVVSWIFWKLARNI